MPNKEGETWQCADLLAYLREKGVKLYTFGAPFKHDGDETITLVDDETAAKRAAKGPLGGTDESLKEKAAGGGIITMGRYRSSEYAKQLGRSGDDSSLLWGRFIVTVVDPEPEGSGKERQRPIKKAGAADTEASRFAGEGRELMLEREWRGKELFVL